MRRKVIGIIVLIAILLAGTLLIWAKKTGKLGFKASEKTQEFTKSKYDFYTGRMIVKLKPGKDQNSIKELNNKYKVSKFEKIQKEKPSQDVNPNRAKRAPKDEDIEDPDISNIHVIEFTVPEKNKKYYEERSKIKKLKIKNEEYSADQFATLDVINDYGSNDSVEYAEPDLKFQLSMVPNDPYWSSFGSWGQSYADLWNLKKIQADKAWDLSLGANIVVAVTDTGVDATHIDLIARLYPGYNFLNNNYIVTDINGHGTHVAGTIAATLNNYNGIIGVAPKAKIMPIKIGDSSIPLSAAIAGISYATSKGADVINMSWGGYGSSKSLDDTLKSAYANGVVLVAAAGNDNSDSESFFPTNSPYVISVASSDHNDVKSSFSNWGLAVDVAAPGGDSADTSDTTIRKYVNILSLRAIYTNMYGDNTKIVGSKYYRARGTSMASPHVAGLAALILSKNMTYTPDQVKSVIQKSALDLGPAGWDEQYGWGRINAYKALNTQPSNLTVRITTPHRNDTVKGNVTIYGEAGGNDFASYKLEYAPDSYPLKWQTIKESSSPTLGPLGIWSTQKIPYQKTIVRLTVTDKSGAKDFKYTPLLVGNVFKTGWPQILDQNLNLGYNAISSPMIADLNKDGKDEIIVKTSAGTLYVFKPDGTLMPGWPKTTTSVGMYYSVASPAIGDVDGDGNLEIVDWGSAVTVLKYDGTQLNQWVESYRYQSGITLADLNKDGKLEIILTSAGNITGKISVYSATGSLLPGWPVYPDYSVEEAAVADINGDGNIEVLVAGWETNKVFSYDKNGQTVPGWPVTLSGYVSNLAIGDLNADGKQEIVAAFAGYRPSGSSTDMSGFQIINNDGSLGKSVYFGQWGNFVPISLGDINNDNRPEIIAAYEEYLRTYTINSDGNPVAVFPPQKLAGYYSYNVVGNVNSDINNEIINLAQDTLSIFNNSGSSAVAGYPLTFPAGAEITPAIGDIDKDGKIEIVVGAKQFADWDAPPAQLMVMEIPFTVTSNSKLQWPMHKHDPQHTGAYK